MIKNISFIGAGNITEILLSNLVKKNNFSGTLITISDPNPERLKRLSGLFAVNTTKDNAEAISAADIIFCCLRPEKIADFINDLKKSLNTSKIVISLSAGVSLSRYDNAIPDIKCVRILPNPPSAIGEGAIPVAFNKNVLEEDQKDLLVFLGFLGLCFSVNEDKIDIFTSITSPAPVLTFVESMVDSAVLCGLDRPTASKMVFQTIKGCLKMYEINNFESSNLIAQACTPGGTSVESLRVMDRGAFRSILKEAYYAAWVKSENMGKG